MKFGLSENIIKEINNVFETYPKVKEVIIFGSRAMGNYKAGSDIDIAVKGNKITLDDILDISVRIENIISPYRMDLINFQSINDPDVIEHIKRVGKIFYKRKLLTEKSIKT